MGLHKVRLRRSIISSSFDSVLLLGAGSRGTNALLATEDGDSEPTRSMGTRARSPVLDNASSLFTTDLFFLQMRKKHEVLTYCEESKVGILQVIQKYL